MRQFAQYLSILLFAASITLSAHAQKRSDVVVNGNTYTYNPINWTMTVPKGWHMTKEGDLDKQARTGSDMIEDATGTSVSMNGVQTLLGFGKNAQNTFQSVIEPFVGRSTQFWTKRHVEAATLYSVFQSQGMYCDTATSIEKIEGKTFQMIYVDIFADEKKKKVILGQTYYSLMVGDYKVFSVILTYNNDADFNTMDKAWRKSIAAIKTN